MAAFVTEGSASTSTTFTNAWILEFQADFRVAYYESAMFPSIAMAPTAINGRSYEFTFFPTMAINTTPLVEDDDVTSVTLTPTKKVMQANQYGNAITFTELADFQTRSKASRASAQVIGINASQTLTRICMQEADNSTNVTRPNGRSTDGDIVATDIVTEDVLEEVYTDLSSREVPPIIDGQYAFVAHERVISDIRSSDKWIEINRYDKSTQILRNEVGTYKGFRVLRNNLSTLGADAGSGNVDVYNCYALGADAIAYGEKSAPEIVVTSFDKLQRFTNVAWKWIGVHKILRDESLQLVKVASSQGNNT